MLSCRTLIAATLDTRNPTMNDISDTRVIEEATFAALCVIAEQLDLERLQRSLLLAHDRTAASGLSRCEDVAAVLRRFGQAVATMDQRRDGKAPGP